MRRHVDLRNTPSAEQEELVARAFSDMADGEALRLTSGYEPRTLRYEFDRAFAARFLWMQRRLGSKQWEVVVRKVPAPLDPASMSHFMTRCAFLADASEATHALLASVVEHRRIPRQTTLVEQDSQWPFLGCVRKGKVYTLVGTQPRRRQILLEIHETEIFGNMVLFDGGTTTARFATLAESADLCLFPREAILRAAASDPGFALTLAAIASQQMRSIAELVQGLVSEKTIARVAAALMPYGRAESGLAAVDRRHFASLRLTHLALATGTVKEVVARAVAELEKVGAIRRARGHISYIDRAKLEALLTLPSPH